MFIKKQVINMFFNINFILASTSKSRISILEKNNLSFRKIKPRCNENYHKKKMKKLKFSPKKISLELSKIKAKSIRTNLRNTLIVGSDTVIDFNGNLLEKAKNIKDAKQKIKKLSGKTHTIISSAVAYYNNKLVWCCSDKTSVKLRKLNELEINQYLNSCSPKVLDSVGCYQIEKNGAIIIEKIKGDFFNVMGFPLFSFLFFLKKFGVKK